MEKDIKKPQIRFQGFTEGWEQRKFDDLCEIITKQTGFDYSATIKPSLINSKREDTYPFIQNKDFSGNNINLNTDFYIPINVAEKFNKILLDKPSVLVSISGRIGNVGFYGLSQKAFIGGAVGICKLKDGIDGEFIVQELESPYGQKYFQSLTKASSHANITVEDIRNIDLYFTKYTNERKAIGDFFEKLDNLIILHQRKYDSLVKVKKSILEKMFPRRGTKKPEIRFAGFTDDWEQRKLEEFVSFFNGLTYTPNDVRESGTLVLRSSNVKDGEIVEADNVYVDPNVVNSENVKEGDIIVVVRNGSRALIGKHAEIKTSMPNTVIGAFMTGIRSKHSSFVNALLDTSCFENEITMNMGATINQITGYMFSKMKFYIPNEKEQEAIGEFFKQFDNFITLHQRKLNLLKNMKKAMLEKMFV